MILFDLCFNPRVLAGGRDGVPPEDKERSDGFNPRVLAGGRDLIRFLFITHLTCFNPRVLAGGRDPMANGVRRDILFQSTRPRGRTRRGVISI